METLLRDLRYGARMLLRKPGVTAVAVLTLALGIGVNSAIFSVVYAVLLRPLPVRDVDRLVTAVMVSRKLNATNAQPGFVLYAALKQHGEWCESVAAASPGTAALSTGGAEETVRFWRVTAGFLSTLGVPPAYGRNFLAEEDQPGGPRVALLSDRYWRNRFNGDPRVLGTAARIDGERYTIVGVLPAGFHVDGRPADVYAPIARSLNAREYMPVNVYARLKPGVSIERAQAEAEAVARSAQLTRPPINWQPRLWRLRDFQVREVRLSLWVLLGAVGLVLLIACANTATLLLARTDARQKEIAVRTSLGAGARRLVRQLLTESTLLALAGGACGVLVAVLCVQLVPLLQHQRLPGLLEQTRVDGAALAFTLAISLLTGLVFGAGPALTARRVSVNETLKEGSRSGVGRRSRRGWNLLVVTETALALILAVGAGLLIRTFFYLRDVAPGFRVDGLMTARITPPPKKFSSREQVIAYWQEVADRVRRVPGVQAATFAQSLPLTGDNFVMDWPVEGYQAGPKEYPVLRQRIVDQQYFAVLQIPLRRGRLFTARDNLGAPKVVLVNEAMVRRFWPGQDPIGKHVGGDKEPLFEVAGVVGDVPQDDTTKDALPEVYFHSLQMWAGRGALAVRAAPRVYPGVRRAVEEVDPTLRVTNEAEMQRLISDRIAPKRLSAQLIGIFAGLALVLAAIGIYGVLSFSVAQRTHEIGVRVAVGAAPGRVLRMVVRQAAGLAGVGIAVGIACSVGLTRVLENLLFGVSATEPWVYAASAAALLLVALAAAAAPAWRAARVDPLVALREE